MQTPISIFITILFSLSLMYCGDKNIPTPCPPNCPVQDTIPYPLEMVWQCFHTPDSALRGSLGFIVPYQDKYIIYTGFEYGGDKLSYIFIVDRNTGKRVKTFRGGKNLITTLHVADRFLIVPSWDGANIYDLEKLKLVKTLRGYYHSTNLTQFGDVVYLKRDYGNVTFSDSSSIIKLHIPSLRTEKVLTITKEEYGGYTHINNISHDIRPNGDTVFYGAMATEPKKFFCYNQTRKSFEWQTAASDPNDFYLWHPLFDEEQVYVTSSFGVEAYNKFTGERTWRKEFLGDGSNGIFRPSEPLLLDGRLYVKQDNEPLYCFRAKDGLILWRNLKAGLAPSNKMSHYKDMLYYVTRGREFTVVGMERGNILYKIRGPNDGYRELDREFAPKTMALLAPVSPLIDKENKLMYLQDDRRMYCFKLWEP